MKVRESGMPSPDVWDGFFNSNEILKTLGLSNQISDVAEFGCGYGTFTIPTAKIVSGKVYALDIEPDMIRMTSEEAARQGVSNVKTILRDFMAEGSGLSDESVDYVMLFNILHLENPMTLLNEAKRILRRNGKLGIIHWNYDSTTPRGPSMEIRPRPEDCMKWAEDAGFSKPIQYDLKPYHYGIVMRKEF